MRDGHNCYQFVTLLVLWSCLSTTPATKVDEILRIKRPGHRVDVVVPIFQDHPLLCQICAHANHRLPCYCEGILFPTSGVLSERKYPYWHHCDDESCSLQDRDCYVYDRPDFLFYLHLPSSTLTQTYFLSHKEYLEWVYTNLYKLNDDLYCERD